MEQVKSVLLTLCVQTAEDFIWNSSTTPIFVCVGNRISLAWVYTLESSEFLSLTSWGKSGVAGGLIPLADDFGGFTPATGYVGRLTRIGNAGIQISNATSSDTETHTVVVTLTSGIKQRMNATVHEHEIANASCMPTCDSSLKCHIPQARLVKNGIDVVWTVEGVIYVLPGNMELVKCLLLLIICVQTAKGFIWSSSTTSESVCVGNIISLPWVYTLESGEIRQLTTWTKSDGSGWIYLADDFVGFNPAPGYVGRLTRIGIAGIQISNATSSDIGTYTVIVALTSGIEHRMNAAVRVHEIANASCIPTCDSSLNCQIPQACPVQTYIDAVKYPNGFQCSLDNNNKPYSVCAEGDAVTLCYNGSSLCRNDTCIATTSTETSASTSSIINTTAKEDWTQ